jgi:hypothetical protein
MPVAVLLASRCHSGCGSKQIGLYYTRSLEPFDHTMKGNQKLVISVTLRLLPIYCCLTFVGTLVSLTFYLVLFCFVCLSVWVVCIDY